jgi:hypothetical protein
MQRSCSAGVPPYTGESTKTDSRQWSSFTGHLRGAFSRVARFYAKNHGRHGIWSCLINRATNQTRLHTGLVWKNTWSAAR